MAHGLIAPLMQLLQSLSRVIVCGVMALVLGACAAGPTAGLQSYQSQNAAKDHATQRLEELHQRGDQSTGHSAVVA